MNSSNVDTIYTFVSALKFYLIQHGLTYFTVVLHVGYFVFQDDSKYHRSKHLSRHTYTFLKAGTWPLLLPSITQAHTHYNPRP